jgi:hypothetical protein
MDILPMRSRSEEIRFYIAGFTKLVEDRVTGDGWNAYFVTFMFHPMPGGKQAKLQNMSGALYRFYTTLLTRVVRKPNSPFHSGQRPLLIAVPDYPVPKPKKQYLSDFAINDGLHFHGILAVPLESRLRADLITHIRQNAETYVKYPLRRVDAVLIEKKLNFVTDYGFKSVKRNRLKWDDVIVLPKSRRELGPTSELREEMARWCELGLLPSILPKSGGTSRPEETDAKALLAFARAFRKTITGRSEDP